MDHLARVEKATERYKEFRASVTCDLYDVSQYIDWTGIGDQLTLYSGSIAYLHRAIDTGDLNARSLAVALGKQPYLYAVAVALLGIPRGVGFHDGRELPDPARRPTTNTKGIADLLIEVGLPLLLPPGSKVEDLVRVALTGLDAGKRRYRVGVTIKERVHKLVCEAMNEAKLRLGLEIQEVPEQYWPHPARERVEYILQTDGRVSVAIASVFQTTSGGRQQKDLSQSFPNLQRHLSEHGINLILVADGRGVRDAKDGILDALFTGVASCITFRQAAQGKLLSEILKFTSSPPSQSRSITRIILSTLNSRGTVEAKELPVDFDQARLALAAFLEDHTDLDLVLGDEGASLFWRRADLVSEAKNLGGQFVAESALEFFAKLINASIVGRPENVNSLGYSIQLTGDEEGVLPSTLLVSATTNEPDPLLFREIAALALSNTPDSKVSILLSPHPLGAATASSLRSLQKSLTSNVVVLDSHLLLLMAQRSQPPTAAVAQQLLVQSDLIKASPFVINSVTPERMFFGRESEEAAMISKLRSNSIALLGGRRIGKTSLMRHVEKRLREGGFLTYFGDCQTVRDWNDFALMARRVWGIRVTTPFKPSKLFELIKELTSSDEKPIILLDEIDQLLDWDQVHTEDEVTEAFFRACRTASQEQAAQFVFSGERIIARRLWDPHSPHWNFCQPIMLRQLDYEAAGRVIVSPLHSMQIEVEDEKNFIETAWSRTNGHPQLLQFLGDRLIRRINGKSPEDRALVQPADLTSISDAFSYAEQYLETYWGQATPFERIVSLVVANGSESVGQLKQFLHEAGIPYADDQLRDALRILELYGILESTPSGYEVLLDWLFDATSFYGGIDDLISLYVANYHE